MSPITSTVWKNKALIYKSTACISLLLLALSAYYLSQRKRPPEAPLPKMVEVERLMPTAIEKTISLIGTIRPKHATLLVAKGSGLLDTLRFSGEQVKKGELIAKIINPDIEKSYALSKATEQIANTQYQRFHSLQKTGFVSAREVEEKKQVWIDAQQERAKTKIELKNMRFYAPFDGIIGAFKIKEGAQVSEGATVVTIYDPNSLTVELDIPCTNKTQIEDKQPIYIFHQLHHLSHMQKMIDDESHMCPADVDIQCPHCLIGASVKVQLVVNKKSGVLVVPTQALFLKNGQPHVYKIIAGQVVSVAVHTGIQEKDKIEISAGLKAGDQVVIKSPERLYPGLVVAIYQASSKNIKG